MHTHTHEDTKPKTVLLLFISFLINILLSLVELIAGILAGSVALIGDALHNTSDAFSILIAILAYKIGKRPATEKFSYGFKRAETIGGFVNLILLFISGVYLLIEGSSRIFSPETINGSVIVWVSILALIIDGATAKLSHTHSHRNSNMKMLFIHNLADALGSIGVIISGLFVIFLGWTFVDGLVAILIALYMIVQSVMAFPGIVGVLMNSAPKNVDQATLKKAVLAVKGVKGVHHIHIWNIDEKEVSMECHVVACSMDVVPHVKKVLHDRFDIEHCTIQVEKDKCCDKDGCTL